jgi:hypothetical protein
MSSGNNQSIVWKDEHVFKMSKKIDHVAENEQIIGKILLGQNLETFSRYIDSKILYTGIDDQSHIDSSPIHNIPRLVTIWENVGDLHVEDLIRDETIPNEIIKSIVLQVCFSVMQVYETISFVHGDLNLKNIMVVPTTKSQIVFLVDNQELHVDTFGYMIKIIDYGESVVWSKIDNRLYTTMFQLDEFSGNLFDNPFHDTKYFLESMVMTCREWRNDMMCNRLDCLVQNMFYYPPQNLEGHVLDSAKYIYEDVEEMISQYIYTQSPETFFKISCGLVSVPIVPGEEAHLDQTDRDLKKMMTRFNSYWQTLCKYLTDHQQLSIFKTISLFVTRSVANNREEIINQEKEFFLIICECMRKFGQDMVSIDDKQTSGLLLTTKKMGDLLKTYIQQRMSLFTQAHLQQLEITKFILSMAQESESREKPKSPYTTIIGLLQMV